jgi:hypothetical protein
MAGSSNSVKKRFDPSKIVTSGGEPTTAGANVRAEEAINTGMAGRGDHAISTDTAKVAGQRKPEPVAAAEAPGKSSKVANYIGVAILLICAFFLFKTFNGSSFSATSDPNKTIEKYYSSVQKNDVETALQQFATSKRPKINRKWLESVAKDTDYYRIEQFKTLQMDKEKAKVLILFYHKKRGSAEEHWDTTLTLVKESGEWRILTMTGNKLK